MGGEMDYWVVHKSQISMKRVLHQMEFSLLSFFKTPCKSSDSKAQQIAQRNRARLALRVLKLRQIIADMEAVKDTIEKRTCKVCGDDKNLNEFPIVPVHCTLATGERKKYSVRRYHCRSCINAKGKEYRMRKLFERTEHPELYRA
jgi:hypothetical protein